MQTKEVTSPENDSFAEVSRVSSTGASLKQLSQCWQVQITRNFIKHTFTKYYKLIQHSHTMS